MNKIIEIDEVNMPVSYTHLPFIISCVAGGIGGAFYGAFNFRKFMVGGMGIFELPAMIEPDGSWGNFIVALAGIGITMVIAFAATMILYKDKKEEAVEVQDGEETLKQVSEPEAAVQEKEEKQESLFVQTEIASRCV